MKKADPLEPALFSIPIPEITSSGGCVLGGCQRDAGNQQQRNQQSPHQSLSREYGIILTRKFTIAANSGAGHRAKARAMRIGKYRRTNVSFGFGASPEIAKKSRPVHSSLVR